MAIQNDNTLVTKGDLKELYTNKIAPYLGGGINYYHTDRTGEELLNLYAGLSSDSPETDSTKVWTATSGAKVPFVKISGSFIMPSTGVITIPAGARVELAVSLADDTANTNTVFGWYNDNTNQPLEGIKDTLPWTAGGAIYTGTAISQWTNDSDEAVNISYRVKILNVASKLRYRYSHLSVQEIGRIVDPVKYVSNNSDLQETPVGNIISYMGNSVPKHYLACDGTLYNIGTYPELEAFIIDEFGSINYFGGDGSSTWAVPDLRGEFLRGTGTNSHENQGNGANVGEHQDATEVATNVFSASVLHCTIPDNNSGSVTLNADSLIQTNKYKELNSNTSTWSSLSYGLSTVRPTNTSVKYCIKYESTFHAFFSNAAYKVSVAASVASHSGAAIAITLDNSDIIGDASLVSGNSFIAPLDGLYLIGMNWSNNGVWEQNYMINVNGADVYHVVGIGVTDMLQLQKGDVVTIKTSKTSAQSGRASFALVTSNYNPTIVSANSVYSENEQMIGYWKNGKPLYQKTIVLTLPEITTDGTSVTETIPFSNSNINIVNPEIGWVESGYVIDQNTGNSIAPINTAWGNSYTTAQYFVYAAFHMNLGGIMLQANRLNNSQCPVVLTVCYTKTTDTASALQVENSLLLNRPDLWTAGTEYHFGGGLYGKRIISSTSQTIAAADQLNVSIATGVSQIINSGGSFKEPSQRYGVQIPSAYYDGGWSTGFWYNSYNSTQDLYYWFKNDSANGSRTITYDVWVLYKK